MRAVIPKAQAWYAKPFGRKPGTRNSGAVVDIPGSQLGFARADSPQAPTEGRALDYIGFDVKDLQAFIKRLDAQGIELDVPYRKDEATGNALPSITNPLGTRIELVLRAPMR